MRQQEFSVFTGLVYFFQVSLFRGVEFIGGVKSRVSLTKCVNPILRGVFLYQGLQVHGSVHKILIRNSEKQKFKFDLLLAFRARILVGKWCR